MQVLLESLYDHAKAGNTTPRGRSSAARGGIWRWACRMSSTCSTRALIILAGERMRYDYLYAAETLAEMENLVIDTGRPLPPIEIHAWGDMLWASGAAALALSA